jgi:hypothetical protein
MRKEQHRSTSSPTRQILHRPARAARSLSSVSGAALLLLVLTLLPDTGELPLSVLDVIRKILPGLTQGRKRANKKKYIDPEVLKTVSMTLSCIAKGRLVDSLRARDKQLRAARSYTEDGEEEGEEEELFVEATPAIVNK